MPLRTLQENKNTHINQSVKKIKVKASRNYMDNKNVYLRVIILFLIFNTISSMNC